MAKGIRANYIVAYFLDHRPDYETCEEFSHRVGLSYTLDTERLKKQKDVLCGLLFRVCRAFGYQIILYNPKPQKGLEQMYVIGEGRMKFLPREERRYKISRDSYTGEIRREVRKYKRKKKKYIKVA